MLILSNTKNTNIINKAVKRGALRYLFRGVYVSVDSKADVETQIKFKINKVLSHLKINGIVSYSSGLYDDHVDSKNTIWLVGSKEKEINLDKLKIRVIKGNETEKNIYGTILLPDTSIRVPNVYRKVLQNFSTRKVDASRVENKHALDLLIQEYIKNHNDHWGVIYNNLKVHADNLNYQKEYKEIILALDQYRKNKNLDNLDAKRVQMFESLSDALDSANLIELKKFDKKDINSCQNLAFFESYFSNYIEGTEFEVEEAYAIVFDSKYHCVRSQDGHDIKKSYALMLDNIQNPVKILNSGHYIDTLKKWHCVLMIHRANEMRVGAFKYKKNKAGDTVFVLPEKIEEMLKFSFSLSEKILDPVKKALFLKITFTEIHPFEDGNGRMSRIILNNFLSLNHLKRLIIPNVFREDYILGLKAFSRNNNQPIIKALNKAGLITNEIPYHFETQKLIAFMYDNSAFCDPDESMWKVVPPKKIEYENTPQLSLFNEVSTLKKFKP